LVISEDECEHFQNTRNSLISESISEYDENFNNVCAKFKYSTTEVCTTGFTGYLNLRRQMVKFDIGTPPYKLYEYNFGSHRSVQMKTAIMFVIIHVSGN
jgi:hypothetical protein